jgi:hypothetical protein
MMMKREEGGEEKEAMTMMMKIIFLHEGKKCVREIRRRASGMFI